ncbi:ammonium transporter Rh type B-like [Ruditapes philippinarum]|uniref:ammonium transporter Rh type B-like n=1 Tax=Ruditapes philippinarum TaxID=129788 RepID=UPI00295C2762|nr:ammonium transporter Rh type B-like [Ruditapes philippinarum]
MGSGFRLKFGTVAIIVQTVFIVLFATLTEYDWRAHPVYSDPNHPSYTNDTNLAFQEENESISHYVGRKYPPFQDVHVMIFIGFGFLMTFLRRYGYSAVSMNMFISSLLIQWAMLVRGCVYEGIFKGNKFQVRLEEMVTADFASATVLISFGAVLGRTSPLQLLIMGLIEVIVAQVNGYVCHDVLHAVDVGESMYIHAFGAYFGLAVSRVLYNKHAQSHHKGESCYHSDLFSMIGTIFLWMYWPSFNGGGSEGDEQHRAYINTYLSLCACTVITFAITALTDKKGKFTMEFIQNATLAGGVAVGTTANMPLQPYGAIIMGCVAGLISCIGYRYITEFLAEKLKIQDTCGVHNLHGMPGVLAAIAGAVMAAMATQEDWGVSLYEIFPYRAPKPDDITNEFQRQFPSVDVETGKGWSAGKQGGYQALALAVTLGIAIVSGFITGLILKIPIFDQVNDEEELFEDMMFWNVPEEEEDGKSEVELAARKYVQDKNV